ncbi:twin arginine-targeting protein translocase TatC [Saccharomonospora sp. CUA-673]|uniref:twin-arginine translocase subunit TatC n=1 Tax=Saccharomonospora sp. CUA-673 TaxID=1904969 RepID=UPI0009617061|nr:twin-arginine translocase subunit TatC [Saccharomonospora sp. CUA-673]OLT46750.1 twin arginine-targeting protein translocase TatC [Saccharomonospora sp. CUA-673]
MRSRRHNPDGTMSLIEHIYEFRRRLGYALIALVAGGILGFIWFSNEIPGVLPSLGNLVTGPYCQIPAEMRYPQGERCQLLQTVPFEAFMIQMKVGLTAGAVLFSPLWLYQFWAFISPGLHPKERKYAMIFVGLASFLFVTGALLAYFMAPYALEILTTFGGGEFATWFTGAEYISFVLTLLLIFGVSFELPLVIIMLNRVGAVRYETLKKWRRGIIMIMFVFAAFVTPADPFSMIALAGALCLLFEISLQVTRFHDRKLDKERGTDGWAELDDNEAAPFEYTPSSADGDDEPRERGRGGTRTDDVT